MLPCIHTDASAHSHFLCLHSPLCTLTPTFPPTHSLMCTHSHPGFSPGRHVRNVELPSRMLLRCLALWPRHPQTEQPVPQRPPGSCRLQAVSATGARFAELRIAKVLGSGFNTEPTRRRRGILTQSPFLIPPQSHLCKHLPSEGTRCPGRRLKPASV